MPFLLPLPLRLIYTGFIVISFFVPLTGCLVDKSLYLKEVEEKTACQLALAESQSKLQDEKDKQQTLHTEILKQQTEINALMEDLATLEVEREEKIRKLTQYKQQLKEREKKITHVTDTYRNLMQHLSQEIDDGKIRIDQSESRLKLNLVDKILFSSGSASLSAKGKEILDKVGFVLKDITDRKIMIEGHTDNEPLKASSKKYFASNWELSAFRATAVVRHLQESVNIDSRLLSATGYSMYQPVASNDTPEGRQENRRIEIILTPLSTQEMQKLYSEPEQPISPQQQPLPLPTPLLLPSTNP